MNKFPQSLDGAAIDSAVAFERAHPGKSLSYSIPLPSWEYDLHVGAIVRVKSRVNGTRYVIVAFRDEFAIVVPVFTGAVCAYPVRIDRIELAPDYGRGQNE